LDGSGRTVTGADPRRRTLDHHGRMNGGYFFEATAVHAAVRDAANR
jgi:hypothetical protein